jgi:hypothetical protein
MLCRRCVSYIAKHWLQNNKPGTKFVFNDIITTLNYIKIKQPRLRLFEKLCEDVESHYVNHTLHIEMF